MKVIYTLKGQEHSFWCTQMEFREWFLPGLHSDGAENIRIIHD